MSKKDYTDEELIAELYRFYNENGKIPRYKDMKTSNGYICLKRYITRFGTWNNALEVAGFDLHKKYNYSKDELILVLQNFYIKNGRSPTVFDINNLKNGPALTTFINMFGSWNAALNAANIPLNVLIHKLDGTETCSKCHTHLTCNWYYVNNNRICNKCYCKERKTLFGTLDPNSSVGFGVLMERVVITCIKDAIWYNSADSLCMPYDFNCKLYNNVNIKARKLSKYNSWIFRLDCKYIPDTFMLIGLNENKSIIEHIWIINSNMDIIKNKKTLTIYNTQTNINKFCNYEVDPEPYNKVYQNLDIYSLPEFCNLSKSEEVSV